MDLDEEDQKALESLKGKQDQLRTAVMSVTTQFIPGLFVFGEGGTGKSFIIQEELEKQNAHYQLHNSRLTSRGLVDALESNPDAIHWIEDAETLVDDNKTLGVLRSACWSQDEHRPMRRPITWRTHKAPIHFTFTGGIIAVSNANLVETKEEIRAIKTRVRVLNMSISKAEVFALMKTICKQGYSFGGDKLCPSKCWEVAKFIERHLGQLRRPLDLRLLMNGFRLYLFDRKHECPTSWQAQLESMISESATTTYVSRKASLVSERQTALKIYNTPDLTQEQKIEQWKAQTKKGKAAFYRALQRSA
jgi:hypothetical protein